MLKMPLYYNNQTYLSKMCYFYIPWICFKDLIELVAWGRWITYISIRILQEKKGKKIRWQKREEKKKIQFMVHTLMGENALEGAKIVVTLYCFLRVPCFNFNHGIIMKKFHNAFAYYGSSKPKEVKC